MRPRLLSVPPLLALALLGACSPVPTQQPSPERAATGTAVAASLAAYVWGAGDAAQMDTPVPRPRLIDSIQGGLTPAAPQLERPVPVAVSPAPSPVAVSPQPSPVAAASVSPAPATAAEAQVARTNGFGAVLRAGPSTDSASLGVLSDGTVVLLTGARQDNGGVTWTAVHTVDAGRDGWIDAELLDPQP